MQVRHVLLVHLLRHEPITRSEFYGPPSRKRSAFSIQAQKIGVSHSTLPKHGPKNFKRLVGFGRVVVVERAAPIILADPVYSG